MKKIVIVGGDDRLKRVKEYLENQGFSVNTLGLYSGDKGEISRSDIVILPVPTTKDGINVFTPLTHRLIPLSFVEESLREDTTVLSCNYVFPKAHCTDYNRLDSYALLNAVPTAEGAVKLAIENTPFTLWQAEVLVIGYGRVGKVLADRLKGMGCFVTVSARKPADFALLSANGYSYIPTADLDRNPLKYKVVFNTVDFPVLSEESFKGSRCKLIIDLSSKGGFSIPTAESYGITAIKAPGLPGIIAPETAGEILAQTVTNIINSFN